MYRNIYVSCKTVQEKTKTRKWRVKGRKKMPVTLRLQRYSLSAGSVIFYQFYRFFIVFRAEIGIFYLLPLQFFDILNVETRKQEFFKPFFYQYFDDLSKKVLDQLFLIPCLYQYPQKFSYAGVQRQIISFSSPPFKNFYSFEVRECRST